MKLQGSMKINEKGHLAIGGCDTVELAKEYGTPLYVMDEEVIRENCQNYYSSFTGTYSNSLVLYASKAFLTMAMCKIVEEEGLGLDVVSGGELFTAVKADFPVEKIYFHGNNKTPQEIQMALDANIGRFVVDNLYEMELLNQLAGEANKKADILIRITPGIEAHTHEYIQTGQIDSKFGLVMSNGQAMEGIKKAISLDNLVLKGLHCHIGSQIFELESYQHAAEVMMEFVKKVTDETGKEMEELNLGGGFGIYYYAGDKPASIKTYAALVMETIQNKAKDFGVKLPKVLVEPGRSIAGPAGTTLYTIGSIKEIPDVRKYVAVDGGMTDNLRPALYQAKYEALVANKANEPKNDKVSIAGKCCESGDMLIWDLEVPKVESGDILAISSTGAYGYSMSNHYNRITKPAVVLVGNGSSDLIVKRESFENLTQNDIIPDRFNKKNRLSVAK